MNEEQKRPEDQHNNTSEDKHKKSSGSAARLDSIISSPTDAARSHRHTDTWSNQGTNTSYEGATAPGGGGSVGTGQASGQDAVGARISTTSGDEAVTGRNEQDGENLTKPEQHNDNLDRDTLGTLKL